MVNLLTTSGCRVRGLALEGPQTAFDKGQVEWFIGDICDRQLLDRAMQGVSHVVHMAALLHINNPAPHLRAEFERVNVQGTQAVVDATRQCDARRLVFLSTIAVYGCERGEVLTESSRPIPGSFYAETKLTAERIVLEARNGDGRPLGVVLRLAAVYGSRVKGNYSRLVQALASGRFVPIGAGGNRRTLVYDEDVAAAVQTALEHPHAGGQVYNVTDGEIHTLSRIIEAICVGLGRRPPRIALPAGPIRLGLGAADSLGRAIGRDLPVNGAMLEKYLEDVAVDGTKIMRELDFRPTYDLTAGWRDADRPNATERRFTPCSVKPPTSIRWWRLQRACWHTSWRSAGVRAIKQFAEQRQIPGYPKRAQLPHARPIPRGGGLAIVVVTAGLALLANAVLALGGWPRLLPVVGAWLLVAAVSLADDLRSLPNRIRFAAHALAALMVILSIGYWDSIAPAPDRRYPSRVGRPAADAAVAGGADQCLQFHGRDRRHCGKPGRRGRDHVGSRGPHQRFDGRRAGRPGADRGERRVSCVQLAPGTDIHGRRGKRLHRPGPGDAGRCRPCTRRSAGVRGPASRLALRLRRDFHLSAASGAPRDVFAPHRSHLYQRLVILGYSHRNVTLLYTALAVLGGLLAAAWLLEMPGASPAIAIVIPLAALGLWAFVCSRERLQRSG